jgi:hypothetical protein
MMRTGRLAVLVALLLGVALCGCAPRSEVAVPSAAASGITADAAPSAGLNACTGDPRTARLVLTDTDNGSRRCLSAAGVVEVYLHGTATDRWSPVELAGTGLRTVASGKSALPIGVTAGFFAGTSPGEAQLTAFRSPCVTADPVSPGCDGSHVIRITVVLS